MLDKTNWLKQARIVTDIYEWMNNINNINAHKSF